jgi:hypothetical protein
MLFFEKWLMTLKYPNLQKPQGTICYQNYQFYNSSEPFSSHHFNVRHPVDWVFVRTRISERMSCKESAIFFANLAYIPLTRQN